MQGQVVPEKNHWKILPITLLIILAILAIPAFIPIPPMDGVSDTDKLISSDSQFITINKHRIHYIVSGKGNRWFIFLHGFGANLRSWNKVVPAFDSVGKTLVYDRPGFGLSDRPLPGQWSNINPYSHFGHLTELREMLRELKIEKAVFIGNSMGARTAVEMALVYPELVEALVLVDPALSKTKNDLFFRFVSQIPAVDHWAPVFVRSFASTGLSIVSNAYHNPSRITKETIRDYTIALKASNWDIGLWEFTKANYSEDTNEATTQVKCPVLLMTGSDDKVIPATLTIALTNRFEYAELVVIPNCGHLPQEECPLEFEKVVLKFIKKLKTDE